MAAGLPLVKIEQIGNVALLTIDNPPVNATSHALRSALKAALEAAIADPAAAAIVLIGAGRGFIAGADITEFERKREEPLNPANIAIMEQSQKPIVAAIHGHALGGGLELAMGCHYRVDRARRAARAARGKDWHHARCGRHAAPPAARGPEAARST